MDNGTGTSAVGHDPADLPPLAPKWSETQQVDLLRAHLRGQHDAPETWRTECPLCENERLSVEVDRLKNVLRANDEAWRTEVHNIVAGYRAEALNRIGRHVAGLLGADIDDRFELTWGRVREALAVTE